MKNYDKPEWYYHQISNSSLNDSHHNHTDNNNNNNNRRIISNHYCNKSNNEIIITNTKKLNHNNYSKLNICLTILLYFLLTNCISFCYTKETNYYHHNDGDGMNKTIYLY